MAFDKKINPVSSKQQIAEMPGPPPSAPKEGVNVSSPGKNDHTSFSPLAGSGFPPSNDLFGDIIKAMSAHLETKPPSQMEPAPDFTALKGPIGTPSAHADLARNSAQLAAEPNGISFQQA